jgi:hypothetical protein
LNVLDYAWNTATSIAQRDYDTFRLVLDDTLPYPVLAGDTYGFVVKLPSPKAIDHKFYSIQGLYVDQDSAGWNMVWRLFKGSLYHLSLHAAFSDFKAYGEWAKSKEVSSATYTVSLVEDMYLMAQARSKWPGILPDIAFCNYISAMRLNEPDEIGSASVRFATKLLFSTAGVFKPANTRLSRDEDKEVEAVAEKIRIKAEESMKAKPDEKRAMLVEAAQDVYSSLSTRGSLSEVPFLPYTEAHGICDLFEGKLLEGNRNADSLLNSAFAHVGMDQDSQATDPNALAEARELLANLNSSDLKLNKIRDFYENLLAPTSLQSVEFTAGD